MHLQFSDAISSHLSSTRSVPVAKRPVARWQVCSFAAWSPRPVGPGALQLSRPLIARCSPCPPVCFLCSLGPFLVAIDGRVCAVLRLWGNLPALPAQFARLVSAQEHLPSPLPPARHPARVSTEGRCYLAPDPSPPYLTLPKGRPPCPLSQQRPLCWPLTALAQHLPRLTPAQ